MATSTTIQTEFVRNFLLSVDILGVYHPDNGNVDEYDAYIDYTAKCLRSGCAPVTWATTITNQLTSCDDGSRYKGFDHKIKTIVKEYKSSRTAFRKLHK